MLQLLAENAELRPGLGIVFKFVYGRVCEGSPRSKVPSALGRKMCSAYQLKVLLMSSEEY